MEKEENMSETVKTIIYAIVIAVLIRSFLFEPFKIPSGSMYPNLYVGDFLFVSKYTYGYSRHSFPFSFPPFEGRIWSSEPKQGDVVVFKFPKDNRTDFIKRIIGMPGDRIKLENGRLFVNGKMLERVEGENFVLRNPFGHAERYHQYTETLPNGVPEGSLFVMGDNRDRSDDSRVSVGFVPMENLVGKARFLFFSYDPNEGAWYKPWTWAKKIRWSRLFSKIN